MTPDTPSPEPPGGRALICGESPVPIDADLVGCGKPILTAAEVFRCTDCCVPFHRVCAIKHFLTDTPEHSAAVFEEQLRRLDAPPPEPATNRDALTQAAQACRSTTNPQEQHESAGDAGAAQAKPVAWRRRYLNPTGEWTYSGVFTPPNPELGPQEDQPLFAAPPALEQAARAVLACLHYPKPDNPTASFIDKGRSRDFSIAIAALRKALGEPKP